MSECNHDCSSCNEECESRSFVAPMNKHSHVKKVIGVVSGKGGVGKSSLTSLLAVLKQREGHKVAVLDADITGPSQAKAFGVENAQLYAVDGEIIPAETNYGMKVMSSNLLLEQSDDPVLWRGPVLGNVIKQFWSDVRWEDVDYMFVDMPPGTGDVPLTVYQSLPLDGIIIITTPQELVGMIVGKAVKMAKTMNIPIYGIIENMSYVRCPECDHKIFVFGKSHLEEVCTRYECKPLGKLPFDSELTSLFDKGMIEDFNSDWLEDLQLQLKDL